MRTEDGQHRADFFDQNRLAPIAIAADTWTANYPSTASGNSCTIHTQDVRLPMPRWLGRVSFASIARLVLARRRLRSADGA